MILLVLLEIIEINNRIALVLFSQFVCMRISFLNIRVISFEVVISKAVFIGFNDESLHECGFSYVHRMAVVVFHIKFIGIESMAAAYPVNTVLLRKRMR